MNNVCRLLSDHDYVIIIALDFSKAFDTVRHSALFDKFADLEIPDNVYNWLVEFFQGLPLYKIWTPNFCPKRNIGKYCPGLCDWPCILRCYC